MTTIENWRTEDFRKRVVAMLSEALEESDMPSLLNVFGMENHVYQNAKTKSEYIEFMGRLISHIKEKKE